MKQLLIVFTAMIFLMSFTADTAIAGSKQHHRWEGVAIGVGAAILGSALINNCQPERVTIIKHNTYYQPDPPRHNRSYCELQRIWVPPLYKKVWNPGHYEYGRWIQGQYIMVEKSPGYWAKERVCRTYR